MSRFLRVRFPCLMAAGLILLHTTRTCNALAPSSPSVAKRLLNRVQGNDRAGDAARSALPFLIGDETMGFVLPPAAEALSRYPSVFAVTAEGVTLLDRDDWKTADDHLVQRRSDAVQEVMQSLRDSDAVPALRGWRDEKFAVRATFHSSPVLILERAAAVLFGVPAYGVFVNGYTCESGGGCGRNPTHVWVGRRSKTKATWPGRLDCLAAGGLAAGMLPRQAMMQECAEEAGIEGGLLEDGLRAVSAVSYTGFNEDKWGLKRDVLFCFDLELPPDFEPVPVDGEMDNFHKVPIDEIFDMLATPVEDDDSDNEWKTNVGVVLTDFLVRHGAVDVDDPSYLELIDALRGAKCA